MATDEQTSQDNFQIGQEVYDNDGNKLGTVQARFVRYVLVERGGFFGKVYYVPRALLNADKNRGSISLGLSEAELRAQGYNQVPPDLYDEEKEPGVPQVFSGVPKFGARPLSPAQTGHYAYGRRWPGINTDAAGSYHREEVMPIPQKLVQVREEDRRKA
jgi:hypothetical protein